MADSTWMEGYAADPNCRYCDGTGVFYGSVCACGCLAHATTGALATNKELEVLTKRWAAENPDG